MNGRIGGVIMTIYLDNNATTPLLPSVRDAIKESMEYFGNPSSLYSEGQITSHMLFHAKQDIADCIGCDTDELIFTSCGSESNCQALFSTYDYAQEYGLGNHIITSQIEHHSIISACEYLKKYRGAEVTYVGVDGFGRINLDDVANAVKLNTCLISIMDSNNEIGTIQATDEIKKIADANGIIYHSDCVQSFMHKSLDLSNYDMFSASGHKIGAPKGIGLLYHKHGTPLLPLVHGTQNGGLRGGTEPVIDIISLAEAIKYHSEHMTEENEYVLSLANHMKERILSEISDVTLNGHPELRLANNLNFTIPGTRGEEVMTLMDMYGISISTGSACNSSTGEPSAVLKAIGLSNDEANSSIRISLSETNTIDEIDFAVDRLKEVVSILRERN